MASTTVRLDAWLPSPCSDPECKNIHYEYNQQRFHPGLHTRIAGITDAALILNILYFYERSENWLLPHTGVEDLGIRDAKQILSLYQRGRVKYEGNLSEEILQARDWGWTIKVIKKDVVVDKTYRVFEEKVRALFKQGNEEEFLKAVEEKLVKTLNKSQEEISPSEFNNQVADPLK